MAMPRINTYALACLPALPFDLGVSHPLEPGDAHRHRRMRREGIGQKAFAVRQATAQRIGDAEMGSAALDRRRGLVAVLDLLERAGERQWVAGELRAHGVGE